MHSGGILFENKELDKNIVDTALDLPKTFSKDTNHNIIDNAEDYLKINNKPSEVEQILVNISANEKEITSFLQTQIPNKQLNKTNNECFDLEMDDEDIEDGEEDEESLTFPLKHLTLYVYQSITLLKNLDTPLTLINLITKLEPTFCDAYYVKALILTKLERYTEALFAFMNAIYLTEDIEDLLTTLTAQETLYFPDDNLDLENVKVKPCETVYTLDEIYKKFDSEIKIIFSKDLLQNELYSFYTTQFLNWRFERKSPLTIAQLANAILHGIKAICNENNKDKKEEMLILKLVIKDIDSISMLMDNLEYKINQYQENSKQVNNLIEPIVGLLEYIKKNSYVESIVITLQNLLSKIIQDEFQYWTSANIVRFVFTNYLKFIESSIVQFNKKLGITTYILANLIKPNDPSYVVGLYLKALIKKKLNENGISILNDSNENFEGSNGLCLAIQAIGVDDLILQEDFMVTLRNNLLDDLRPHIRFLNQKERAKNTTSFENFCISKINAWNMYISTLPNMKHPKVKLSAEDRANKLDKYLVRSILFGLLYVAKLLKFEEEEFVDVEEIHSQLIKDILTSIMLDITRIKDVALSLSKSKEMQDNLKQPQIFPLINRTIIFLKDSLFAADHEIINVLDDFSKKIKNYFTENKEQMKNKNKYLSAQAEKNKLAEKEQAEKLARKNHLTLEEQIRKKKKNEEQQIIKNYIINNKKAAKFFNEENNHFIPMNTIECKPFVEMKNKGNEPVTTLEKNHVYKIKTGSNNVKVKQRRKIRHLKKLAASFKSDESIKQDPLVMVKRNRSISNEAEKKVNKKNTIYLSSTEKEYLIALKAAKKYAVAYFVGGLVRGRLKIGKNYTPNDYDIATNLSVEEISAIFSPKAEEIKIIGSLVQISMKKGPLLEIMSIKDLVHSRDSLKKDAEKRDFTMNALFVSLNEENEVELDDPTGFGIVNLKNNHLATIISSELSFSKDPVRILRVVKLWVEYQERKEELIVSEGIKNSLDEFKCEQYEVTNIQRVNCYLNKLFYAGLAKAHFDCLFNVNLDKNSSFNNKSSKPPKNVNILNKLFPKIDITVWQHPWLMSKLTDLDTTYRYMKEKHKKINTLNHIYACIIVCQLKTTMKGSLNNEVAIRNAIEIINSNQFLKINFDYFLKNATKKDHLNKAIPELIEDYNEFTTKCSTNSAARFFTACPAQIHTVSSVSSLKNNL